MDTADINEFCHLVAANYGCSDTCGFKWDATSGQCSLAVSAMKIPSLRGRSDTAPIIGGSGKFRYQVTAGKKIEKNKKHKGCRKYFI